MSQTRKFTLGHSPDPDDAFMFYAMAEGKIDLRGFAFEHILQDIQTLNERATRGELDISAVSIHALAYVTDKYALLPSGASMGDGYGPMFIVPGDVDLPSDHHSVREWIKKNRVAVPGAMTSAFLAARLCIGEFEHEVVPFDQIFDAVKAGKAAAGLIIHEGQLTYRNEGMRCILDLGEWWKEETGLPLPLGGNVIRKDIETSTRHAISEILHESIRYGLEHRANAVEHSMPLARGMDSSLADRFIGMYVNDFTLDYGPLGRQAVSRFLGEASDAGLIPAPVSLEFVE